MRVRYTVALDSEHLIDSELIDYIVSHDKRKRQEVLRMLLRAGFNSLIKHRSTQESMLHAMDPDALQLVLQSLAGIGLAQQGGMPMQMPMPAAVPVQHPMQPQQTMPAPQQHVQNHQSYVQQQEQAYTPEPQKEPTPAEVQHAPNHHSNAHEGQSEDTGGKRTESVESPSRSELSKQEESNQDTDYVDMDLMDEQEDTMSILSMISDGDEDEDDDEFVDPLQNLGNIFS